MDRTHGFAVRRTWLIPALTSLVVGVALAAPAKTPKDLKKAAKAISVKRLKKHLYLLAADAMEGREAGSRGGHDAAVYLARCYAEAGLEPGGSEGFFQPFGAEPPRGELADGNALYVARSKLAKKLDRFALGEHLRPLSFSASTTLSSEVVFGGYGISAPEQRYDDYEGLDVAGRAVLVLAGAPTGEKFAGRPLEAHAGLRGKLENALAHGAVALLIVTPKEPAAEQPDFPEDPALTWPPKAGTEVAGLPTAYISRKAAAALLKRARKTIAGLAKSIASRGTTSACSLKGAELRLQIARRGPATGGMKNVIALHRGTDPKLRDEYIVLSAHYDHVGRGSRQNSRGGVGQIHNGADDNASGTSGLLELARVLKPLKLKRSILLMSFDAEEKGLVGSKHYAQDPVVPLEKIVTILNMDMISRNARGELFVGGIGRNARLDALLRSLSERYKLRMRPDGMEQYLKRSDQWSFMEHGVPGLFFFGGMHEDYHKATDDPDKCDLVKMKLITQVCLVFLYELANAETNPRAAGR